MGEGALGRTTLGKVMAKGRGCDTVGDGGHGEQPCAWLKVAKVAGIGFEVEI